MPPVSWKNLNSSSVLMETATSSILNKHKNNSVHQQSQIKKNMPMIQSRSSKGGSDRPLPWKEARTSVEVEEAKVNTLISHSFPFTRSDHPGRVRKKLWMVIKSEKRHKGLSGESQGSPERGDDKRYYQTGRQSEGKWSITPTLRILSRVEETDGSGA